MEPSARTLLDAHVQRTKSLRNVSAVRMHGTWKVTVTVITPYEKELGEHRRMADGWMLTDCDYDPSKEIAEERASYEILIAIEEAHMKGEYEYDVSPFAGPVSISPAPRARVRVPPADPMFYL